MKEFFSPEEKSIIENIQQGLERSECDIDHPLIKNLDKILGVFATTRKNIIELIESSKATEYSLVIDQKLNYPEIRLQIKEKIIGKIRQKINKLLKKQLKDVIFVLTATGYRITNEKELDEKRFMSNTTKLREHTYTPIYQNAINTFLEDFHKQITEIESS